jgi:hypothetical protein
MPGADGSGRASGGTSYVSVTAEDLPPSPGAWSGSSRTNCIQYIGESRYKQFLIRQQRAASLPPSGSAPEPARKSKH